MESVRTQRYLEGCRRGIADDQGGSYSEELQLTSESGHPMQLVPNRFLPIGIRPRANPRRNVAECALAIERLEERRVPAELSGSMVLATSIADRGQSVDAFWSVSNFDFDTIFTQFEVSFYLSRDGILSGDDYFLNSATLPFGFPGLFTTSTQFTSLNLPGPTDAYWSNDTNFQVLMNVDDFGEVFEFNEFDNLTNAFLTVNRGGGGTGGGETDVRLEDLPATNLPPGIVVTEMLNALQIQLKASAKDYTRIAKAGRGLVDFSAVVSGIKTLRTDVIGLIKSLSPLVSGKVSSLPVAEGSLTAAGLELADRAMVDILLNTFSTTAAAPARLAKGAGSNSVAHGKIARADDDDFLNRVRVDIKKTYVDAGIQAFEKTADAFKKAAAWVPGVGQIAAGAAAISTAIGRMLKFGAANIFEGDAETFRRLGSPENTNLVEEYIGEAAKEARDRLLPDPRPEDEAERQLLQLYQHAYDLSRNLDSSAKNVDAQFDELFARLNGNRGGGNGGEGGGGDTGFRGKWEGNLIYPSEFGDIGGPMNFTFKKPQSDGTLRGTATLTFSVLDGTTVVDRDLSRGDFTMRSTGANTFRGSMTITGRGNTASTEFSVRFENGLLIGSLDSNPQSTFTIRTR